MIIKNAIVELNITDIDYMGYGIAHEDNHTIFIPGAVDGDTVRALIVKVTDNVAFGKLVEVLKHSEHRVKPKCQYANTCGGCDFLHISYEHELEIKEKLIKTTISKMVKDINYKPIISSDNPENYRNKVSLPIGFKEDSFVTGFYKERTHEIIPASYCCLEQDGIRKIVNIVLDKLNKSNLYPYDEENNTGDIRHLVVRGNHYGKFMLIIVATSNKKKILDFAANISIKDLDSIYININKEKTNVILGDEFIHVSGKKFLTEDLFENTYEIHPNSFFQVNYFQMLKLYKKAIEYLEPNKDDVVLDAYCGIGTIGMSFAKSVKKVYGIEVVKEAIDNANITKENNHVENIEFILGKCEEQIPDLVKNHKLTKVILDPPRKGCEKAFLDSLIENGIEDIVYISCGPAALARDLAYLKENGYQIIEFTPVDMFPRTVHVESVVKLKRIDPVEVAKEIMNKHNAAFKELANK